jgi:hypothetical protein
MAASRGLTLEEALELVPDAFTQCTVGASEDFVRSACALRAAEVIVRRAGMRKQACEPLYISPSGSVLGSLALTQEVSRIINLLRSVCYTVDGKTDLDRALAIFTDSVEGKRRKPLFTCGVPVLEGQPVTSRKTSDEYFKGLRMRSSSRTALNFWRKFIPAPLLRLVALSASLEKSRLGLVKDVTVANSNCCITTYLAWCVWRVASSEGMERTTFLPPWGADIFTYFAADMVSPLDYSATYTYNCVLYVRAWMERYPQELLGVNSFAEVAAWLGERKRAVSAVQRLAKRWCANKAPPFIVFRERWMALTRRQRAIVNLWGQLGCRLDTLLNIHKGDFAVLPLRRYRNVAPAKVRPKTLVHDFVSPLSPGEGVYVFVEKEKISSHEARWVPFSCNCCSAADIGTPARRGSPVSNVFCL